MSTMLDDNLGRIFTSSPGILVHLRLLRALSTVRWLQSEEGKVHCAADVSLPRGVGKLFVLTQCQSLPRILLSAHLRMFLKDIGGHLF